MNLLKLHFEGISACHFFVILIRHCIKLNFDYNISVWLRRINKGGYPSDGKTVGKSSARQHEKGHLLHYQSGLLYKDTVWVSTRYELHMYWIGCLLWHLAWPHNISQSKTTCQSWVFLIPFTRSTVHLNLIPTGETVPRSVFCIYIKTCFMEMVSKLSTLQLVVHRRTCGWTFLFVKSWTLHCVTVK